MKVFVYYNLHKKCWSIRHKGKVIQHADQVYLKDVKFKVSEAGRQRVLKEKRKNVHAGVEGLLISFNRFKKGFHIPVSYNPYKGPNFYQTVNNQPIFEIDQVYLNNKKVYLKGK